MNDSLFNKNKINILNSVILDKEMQKREQEYKVEKQKNEIQVLKAENKSRYRLVVLIAVLFAFTILLMGGGIIYYKQRLKLNKFKLEQTTLELSQKDLLLEQSKMQTQLEIKNKELDFKRIEMEKLVLYITENSNFLEQLKEKIISAKAIRNIDDKDNELTRILNYTLQNISLSSERKEFDIYIDNLYKDFLTNLTVKYPELNEHDKRLAALIKLNYSTKEIASILNISQSGVEKQRYRLRKKINIPESVGLAEFLATI